MVMWVEINCFYVLTGAMLSMREVGAFAALQAFNLPVIHALQGPSRLLLPYLSRMFGDGGPGAMRLLVNRLSIAFAVVTGTYWLLVSSLSGPLLHLLYGPQYAPYSKYLFWSMITLVCASAILPRELGLRAVQAPDRLLRGTAFSSISSVVLGTVLIKLFGFPGMIAATAMVGVLHFTFVTVLFEMEVRRDRSQDSRAALSERGGRLPVLVYHHVGPRRPGIYRTLTLSRRRFARQMECLSLLGFHSVTQAQVIAWMRGEQDLPPKPVMITFDDAYEDLCEHALPTLTKYGFTALVFVVTGHVGGTNLFDQKNGCGPLRLMDVEQIRTWADRGIEFGAHSRSHIDLAALKPEELAEEIVGSGMDLNGILQVAPISFAYPYGSFNADVEQKATGAYNLVFTIESGMNERSTPAHRVRRTVTHYRDSILDVVFRASWGWSPIETMREALVRPLRPLLSPFRDPYVRSGSPDA